MLVAAYVLSLLLAETPAGNPSKADGIATPRPSTIEPAPLHESKIHRPSDESLVDQLAAENLKDEGSDIDLLEYSQKELQGRFEGGLALNLGPVMPWSEYGASLLWKKNDIIQSVSLGAGNFKFSDNYRERNYLVKTDSQSAYYAARWFVLGFGPVYLEPFAGLVRWSGSIRPRGYDAVNDRLASSLNSRFDITGVSIGGSFGLMWIFANGVFLDCNLFSISSAAFIQKTFTTNTEEAKKNVRKELGGPLTMSSLQLRVGWSLKI